MRKLINWYKSLEIYPNIYFEVSLCIVFEINLSMTLTMIVDTDDQSKLEQLKKSKDKSYKLKSAEHIPEKF